MEAITLQLNENGRGAFVLREGEEQLGEMVVSVKDTNLTVYHTEVAEQAQGRGLAKKLLDAMVHHARTHGLKVVALCPYVHAQFSRHPDTYADIWDRSGEKERH